VTILTIYLYLDEIRVQFLPLTNYLNMTLHTDLRLRLVHTL